MSGNICVITPCFNAGPFLLPCLESVAAQGPAVSRHIIMDGGSTDGSIEVLGNSRNPILTWCGVRNATRGSPMPSTRPSCL